MTAPLQFSGKADINPAIRRAQASNHLLTDGLRLSFASLAKGLQIGK
jgi:hypothetical protein